MSPTSASALSTGQSASISVITGGLCAWTATSAVPWITITGGASMTGLGSTNYTVAPNGTGSSRTGTLTVAGQIVTITESTGSCSYDVSPTSASALSTGQSASISVITGGLCAWTATSAVPWITITGGASMTGLGSTNYTVAPNGTGSARTGTLTVAGQIVTITQSTAAARYSVSPTSASALSTGQSSSISVTTGGLCAWTATSAVPWITITGGASMTGLGSTNYTVAPNGTGSARTGTLTVAGQIVTITQSTGSCTYSVSPTSASALSTGQSGSISVIDGRSLRVDGDKRGALDHDHGRRQHDRARLDQLHVAPNATGSARTGTLTVAGQIVTITQSTGSCSYSVSPTSASALSTGQSSSISVTTGGLCAWTATSAVPWITITGGASMTGLGSTNYTVAPNATGSSRTGTLTVAGQIVTIIQSTGSCTYSVTPTSMAVPSTGSLIAISVVTGSSCAWTSTSSVAWIVVNSGASMSGLGSANFTVAATTSPRTGTLTVAGQIISITQSAAQPPASPANLRIISIVY